MISSSKQSPYHSRAFTTIELLIVIVILGVMGAIIIVSWPSSTSSLRAQARQLASDIRYIQYLSMTQNQRYRINFFSTSYTLTALDGITLIANPPSGSASVTLSQNITLSMSGVPNSFLVFDGQGVPYTTNVLPGTTLATTAVITLSSSGNVQQVSVYPNTGQVSPSS